MDLKLRRLREEDIFQIMEWRMRPDVTKYMYTDPDLTEEKQKKWFENISNSDKCKYWTIFYKDNKIGVINLYDIDSKNKRAFWAYYIGEPDFRGKGFGRPLECNIYDYVLRDMDFHKLCCEVFKGNQKVVNIHKKFGSKIEGEFGEHIYKNDNFHDVVRMAILKNEWENIRNDIEYEEIEIE